MRESRARRRIGNLDDVIACRTLNLPPRVTRIALQRLVAVGTVELEIVRAYDLSPHHAQFYRAR